MRAISDGAYPQPTRHAATSTRTAPPSPSWTSTLGWASSCARTSGSPATLCSRTRGRSARVLVLSGTFFQMHTFVCIYLHSVHLPSNAYSSTRTTYSSLLYIYFRTFSPLDNKDQILQKLEEVAVELEKDMNESGWTGRTVTLKYKLDTYQGTHIVANATVRYQLMSSLAFLNTVFTRAKSFDRWITKKEELFAVRWPTHITYITHIPHQPNFHHSHSHTLIYSHNLNFYRPAKTSSSPSSRSNSASSGCASPSSRTRGTAPLGRRGGSSA